MNTSLTRFCVVIGLLLGTAAAQGQNPHPQDLVRVEENVGDVTVLSTSLRNLESGLQGPTRFKDVYLVPGRDGEFMRVDGALHAVFPQSIYLQTRQGIKPGVPPGTVYYIGAPPAEQPFGPGRAAVPGDPARVIGWIPPETRLYDPPPLPPEEPAGLTNPVVRARLKAMETIPQLVADQTYRRRRLHQLMQQAATERNLR